MLRHGIDLPGHSGCRNFAMPDAHTLSWASLEGMPPANPESATRKPVSVRSTRPNLAEDNTIVGVISHIKALEDRIPRHLEVKKDSSGCSHAKLII